MARPAWLTLGVLACMSCGTKVVSMEGTDARMQTELPPPQRGGTDSSVSAEDAPTTPPPPVDTGVDVPRPVVDTGVDVPRPVDLGTSVDRQPDIITAVDAAPDVPVMVRCTTAAGTCPAGMVCMAPNCGNNGTCVAAPADTEQNPVCGCDRITYWNASVAAANSTAVRSEGACANGAATSVACNAQTLTCPNAALCNLEQASDATCNQNAAGHCWMLPDVCPADTMPMSRRCVGGGANPACMSACDLIRAGRVFTADPTCP